MESVIELQRNAQEEIERLEMAVVVEHRNTPKTVSTFFTCRWIPPPPHRNEMISLFLFLLGGIPAATRQGRPGTWD